MQKRAVSAKRERRLSRRLMVWSERIALGSVLLFLLGLGGVVWAQGGARLLGAGFALAGLVGLGLHLRLLWRTREARLRLQRAAARRAELQASRRERADRERLRRQAEQETRAYAAERLEQARRAQKQVAAQALQEEMDRRNERTRRGEGEALRIAALSDAELHREVAGLLTQRGYRAEPADSEYPGDFLLHSEAGFEVLRCVPAGKKAGGVDVEALEAWRTQAGAERAYLVATAGFLPSAIERLAQLPLTLVEPHLLAHWRQE
ncbi:MAG: hypothetical protein JWL77_1593 [Chthonomonadaceae bacterium]|nr:hypothetical protein [Chthonomonadaceae bacterium]